MCSIELCLTPLIIFCFVWAVPKALTRRDLEVVLLAIVSLFTAHGLLTAYMVATNTHCLFGQELLCTTGRPQLYWGERGALVTGLFANPNGLGSCLILLPAIAFYMATRLQRTGQRAFLFSSGSLLLLNLLVLMSRSCSLTTLAGLAVAGVSGKLLKPWVRCVALGAMLLALFCGCYAIFDWRSDNSTCLRSFIWMGFVDAVLENPFGSGWNSVAVFNQNPHNCLLANLVYFGFTGFVLLLALFIMLIARAANNCRQDRTSAVLVLSLASMLLIHQSVEYVISYPLLFSNSIFWLLLGYAQLPSEVQTNKETRSRPVAVPACAASETA